MQRPHIAIVGPHLGRWPGRVPSQGEILGQKLAAAGYTVHLTSHRPRRLPRLADTVASLVRGRGQIDVVLLMVFSGPAFFPVDVASWLARRLRKPLVLWLHGGQLPRFARDHPAWLARVYRRAHCIVAPTRYLSQTAAHLGLDTAVIPNILDVDSIRHRLRSQPAPNLLWMRTFHDIYHPALAVEALARIVRDYPKARLTMAGQDDGRLPAVQALAVRLGVAEHVRFPGFLDAAAKREAFAAHDIFLNTNRIDNMPVSVIEAAAAGLPVVATRVGGIPYLLEDGETALLVDDGDAAGMATAVTRLLQEPDLSARLSANGRELALASAWPRVRPLWEQLFQTVLVSN